MIAFHNVRSLHAHFADLSSDPNHTSANVLCCVESRLQPSDLDSQYCLPEHSLLRFDQPNRQPHVRPPHGIAIYVKEDIEVIDFGNMLGFIRVVVL